MHIAQRSGWRGKSPKTLKINRIRFASEDHSSLIYRSGMIASPGIAALIIESDTDRRSSSDYSREVKRDAL
jgi:hypothetical protein